MELGSGDEAVLACLAALADVPDEAPWSAPVEAVGRVLTERYACRGLLVARPADDGSLDVVAATGSLGDVEPGARIAPLSGEAAGPCLVVDAIEVRTPTGARPRPGPLTGGRSSRLVLLADRLEWASDPLPVLAGILEVDLRRRGTVGELARTAGRLTSLVGSAALAIVAMDADGDVTLWNRGAVDLLGWSEQEMLGTRLADLLPPDESGLDLPAMQRAIDEGRAIEHFELELRGSDGRYRELEGALSPIFDGDGHPAGSSVIYRDVGRRNDALRQLAANEELFRLLADSSQDVVYRLQLVPEGRVEYVSPAARERLGFDPQELYAHPALLGDRVHPDDRGKLADAGGLSGTTSDRIRIRFQHADGRWLWVDDHRTPLTGPHGELLGVSGVLRDVTAEVESERRLRHALERERAAATELRRADEMKTTFLSAVSHELRTPLTSILGFAETAERSLAAQAPAPVELSYVRRVRANAHRLQQLIGDLLDVDRLTRGAIVAERARLDLVPLLHGLAAGADLRAHVLELDLPGSCEADLDGPMVERTVDNLLRNALRHTPDGTRVVLRLRAAEDHLELVIEDDGPGVPPDAWSRVFEPFEQGENATHAASPGTGVGLSLVQRFVGLHDGRVELDERPGGGARFTVVLPRWARRG